jgi:hypothetical protein
VNRFFYCCVVSNSVCRPQNTEHNHTLDKTVYNSYQTSSEIEEADLFKEIVAMVEADGSTKLICDRISRRFGRTFTSRQLHNWKQYRLGGNGALSRLKILLRKFAAADGSRVLVMKNEEGILSGIALQSRVQQKMFERWGDSLLFDFTHNTNNLGFYMGTLKTIHSNPKNIYSNENTNSRTHLHLLQDPSWRQLRTEKEYPFWISSVSARQRQ